MKRNYVEIICRACGKKGSSTNYHIKYGYGLYCSSRCAYDSRKKIPLEERFFRYVNKQDDGCWLWMAAKTHFGYGQLGSECGKTKVQAHRVSYKIFKGEIPKGMCVLHSCDVPACVNPEHLWLGTKYENTQDMIKKGRDRLRTQQKYFTKEERREAHRLACQRYEDKINPNRKRKKRYKTDEERYCARLEVYRRANLKRRKGIIVSKEDV